MDKTPMIEFELKLEIPPPQLPALLAAVRAAGPASKRLQARYFDTDDDALARAGIVLRLRKEGRTWVQTAKCAGDGPLERLEHAAAVGALPPGAQPEVSASRHEHAPLGERIRRALDVATLDRAPALQARFETDVRRLACKVPFEGSVVEVALDRGKVMAAGRESPLCEIEFELIQGDPAHAVGLARLWRANHGLWLSTTSKSAKGRQLAAGAPFGPPVEAEPPRWDRHARGEKVALAVVRSCLHHVLGNASQIGAGSLDAEHIHQLRVGIRRLRTAMRELRALAPPFEPEWEPALVAVFRALGEFRDHDHLERTTQPQLVAQGAPPLDLESLPQPPDLVSEVRGAAFQDALLGLLEFAHTAARTRTRKDGAAQARRFFTKRLDKLNAQVGKDGRRFQSLDAARQHRVRKRAKRLRYLAEFAAPLFSARKVTNFMAGLKAVQDALGAYNDEAFALAAYRSLAQRDPGAWFGIGWLTARRQPNAARCESALEKLAKSRPFWT